jgi:FKBP-type peptidyl-prolyl cis-trans isomerase FklB
MKTEMEKVSYIIGRNIGADFKAQGLDLDLEILKDSMTAAFAGEESKIDDAEMHAVMTSFQQQMQEKANVVQAQAAEINGKAGEEFLAANKEKEGIEVTASGLQYRVLQAGTGEPPSAEQTVEVHYEGKLLDGTVFDSSIARGESISFPVNGVIQGWQEALQLMKVGQKMELFIPSDLAYGAQGAGQAIGPHATLIFEVELLAIK